MSKTSSRDSGVQFSIGSSTLSTSARTSSISDDKKSIPDIIEEVELDEIENGIKEFKLDEPGESNSIQNFTLNDFTESIGTSDQDSSPKTKIFTINTCRYNTDIFNTSLLSYNKTTNECLLPHFTIKLTFLLCWAVMIIASGRVVANGFYTLIYIFVLK